MEWQTLRIGKLKYFWRQQPLNASTSNRIYLWHDFIPRVLCTLTRRGSPYWCSKNRHKRKGAITSILDLSDFCWSYKVFYGKPDTWKSDKNFLSSFPPFVASWKKRLGKISKVVGSGLPPNQLDVVSLGKQVGMCETRVVPERGKGGNFLITICIVEVVPTSLPPSNQKRYLKKRFLNLSMLYEVLKLKKNPSKRLFGTCIRPRSVTHTYIMFLEYEIPA